MDYSQWSPAALFNLNGGTAGGPISPAGEALPRTSHRGGDRGAVPWSPDSPHFWVIALGVLTLAGIVGASVTVKAGPGRASAALGKV